ncbi:hypothetical protein [Endozoicomonas sp.]|uniref:hypothetical protein n=1 Tax=Endozoicomonas sp. TaxID=1892382 RepID=UPI00383B70E3
MQRELRSHVNSISEIAVGSWWEFCIRYLCVGLLLLIVGNNLVTAATENYGGYASADQMLFGWGMVAAMVVAGFLISTRRPFSMPVEA